MIIIIRNFLSVSEINELNAFVDEGIEHKWLGPGIDRGSFNYNKRYTSRLYSERFSYPNIVYDVFSKITNRLSLHKLKKSVHGGGQNGIVVSCTFEGGDVYEHIDPKEEDGLEVLRCNIMTRKPVEGGILFVGGKKIELEEGDLHCYLASNIRHCVTPVIGSRSRILWMFGYQISKSEWSIKLSEL